MRSFSSIITRSTPPNGEAQVVVTTPTGVRAEAYVYDDLNRLIQVTYSDDNGTIDLTDRFVKYSYDKNGNRLTMTSFANGVEAGATQTLSYPWVRESTDEHHRPEQRGAGAVLLRLARQLCSESDADGDDAVRLRWTRSPSERG